ncbi:hypothetical protein B5S31_g4078 [[Candida] boidinii]|nr:hypothetical protein B5S31_g4078 [[Candida] boidinii]
MINKKTYNFIVTPSAFVGGIGNIKQWYNDYDCNFFIPTYTLKELDFLKKGVSLIATNARESIRFIDKEMSLDEFDFQKNGNLISNSIVDAHSYSYYKNDLENDHQHDHDGDDDDCNSLRDFSDNDSNFSNNDSVNEKFFNSDDENNSDILKSNKKKTATTKTIKNKIDKIQKTNKKSTTQPSSEFVLETPDEEGPDWKHANGYRRRTPLVSEFPSKASNIGALGGPKYNKTGFNQNNKISDTFKLRNNKVTGATGEGEAYHLTNGNVESLYKNDDSNDDRAFVPRRLKLLIRSCLQKRFVENKNLKEPIQWFAICEDSETYIWLKCYGIDVVNLNEVQSIFDKANGNKGKQLFQVERNTNTNNNNNNNSNNNNKKIVFNGKYELSIKKNRNKRNQRNNKRENNNNNNNISDSDSNQEDNIDDNNSFNKYKNMKKINDSLSNKIEKPIDSKSIYKERFDSMSYAPRGKGELWTP